MNKAEEVESVKIANPEIKTSHPFEDKYFLEVIKKYAPEYIDRLKDTARPGISDNPDELESWEAGQIGRRKKQLPYESDYGYAVRVLYEETFSVNQFPKKPFKESNGLTVGGLISHFYTFTIVDGVNVAQCKDWEIEGDNLGQALANIEDMKRRGDLLTAVEEATNPIVIGGGYFPRLSTTIRGMKILREPKTTTYREDLDTYGFRLAKLFNQVEELSQPVQDPKIKEAVGFPIDRDLTRADALHYFWKRVGPKVINNNGAYKLEGEEGTQEGLTKLLFFRTHPEMQFLYKYMSPSGYLNENKKKV